MLSEGFIADFDSIPLIVSKISTRCFVFHAGQGLATVTCSGSVSVEISIDFLKVFTLTMKLSLFSLGVDFWVLSRLYIGSEGSLLYFSSCIRVLLSLLSSMDWRPDRVSISRMGVDFIPPVINLRF